jgi:DAACS family dicarboxylate/amino acid:cation (Na+ or H+) symporter
MLVGLAIGAGAGLGASLAFPGSRGLAWTVENVAQPLGQIFLRMLFMLVVPLLFSALVVGIAELQVASLGKLGVRTLAYTVLLSAIAVVIGIVLVNLMRPGDSIPEGLRALARSGPLPKAAAPGDGSAIALLVAIVPDNPVKAAASGDMIGVIFFSLLFGVALAVTRTDGAARLRDAIAGLQDVCMKLVDWVLALAPLGVGALLFAMTARVGLELLAGLAAYVAVVLGGLALHCFGVYALAIRLLGGLSPARFFSAIRLAMATAFSTASSSATLPTALRVADEELRLPSGPARFVLTAGSAMNQNGTALFEGVTVLFLAQAYGIEMDVGRQAVVMGICVLAGIGTAGVPAGSIPVIAMILAMFGIPAEGLGLVLGVDRLLDMCRTTLNVTGDLVIATCVSRGEREGDGA